MERLGYLKKQNHQNLKNPPIRLIQPDWEVTIFRIEEDSDDSLWDSDGKLLIPIRKRVKVTGTAIDTMDGQYVLVDDEIFCTENHYIHVHATAEEHNMLREYNASSHFDLRAGWLISCGPYHHVQVQRTYYNEYQEPMFETVSGEYRYTEWNFLVHQ